MKPITWALCLSALLSAPIHAETLCQEEAKAVGYVGPIDTLKPCTPERIAARKADSDQVAKAREQQGTAQQQDASPVEIYGQIQIQE